MPKYILVSIIVFVLAAFPIYFLMKKETKTPEEVQTANNIEQPAKKEKQAKAPVEAEEENYTITSDNVTPAKSFSDITGTWKELIMSGYTPEIGFEFNLASNDPNLSLDTNVLTLKNNTYNKTYNNKMCDTPGILTASLKFDSAGQFALDDPQFDGCENFYFTPKEIKVKSATFYKFNKNYLVLVMNDANTAVVFKRQR